MLCRIARDSVVLCDRVSRWNSVSTADCVPGVPHHDREHLSSDMFITRAGTGHVDLAFTINSLDHGNAGDGMPTGSDGPGERNRNSTSDQANSRTGTLHGTFLEGTAGAQGSV